MRRGIPGRNEIAIQTASNKVHFVDLADGVWAGTHWQGRALERSQKVQLVSSILHLFDFTHPTCGQLQAFLF